MVIYESSGVCRNRLRFPFDFGFCYAEFGKSFRSGASHTES
jgi:hypothetical protein